jgi:hypothetical protein
VSKSFPELILQLTVAGRQLLGLCTSGPRGAEKRGSPQRNPRRQEGSGLKRTGVQCVGLEGAISVPCLAQLFLPSLNSRSPFQKLRNVEYPPKKNRVKSPLCMGNINWKFRNRWEGHCSPLYTEMETT